MSWTKLFASAGHAEVYRKFRPNYPDHLYTAIISYLNNGLPWIQGSHHQAIDVGCGSGQNTRELARYFDSVLGTDISEAQVNEANKNNQMPNIQYKCGNFDHLFKQAGSIDLVTCALAAHWFEPIDAFYKEVDRVLRPNGVLAIFGYGMPAIECTGYDSNILTDAMMAFYNDDRLQQYVTGPGQEVSPGHYKNFNLPYDGWQRDDSMYIKKDMTFDDFLGYLNSWSYYWKFKENHPDSPDPLQELSNRYEELLGEGVNLQETRCSISWPIFLLMARKPDR